MVVAWWIVAFLCSVCDYNLHNVFAADHVSVLGEVELMLQNRYHNCHYNICMRLSGYDNDPDNE